MYENHAYNFGVIYTNKMGKCFKMELFDNSQEMAWDEYFFNVNKKLKLEDIINSGDIP